MPNVKNGKTLSINHASSNPYAGKTILQLAEKNPRHPDTQGYFSFEIVRKAGGKITYEEFKARGGRPQDLKWDLDHGYVKLAGKRGRKPGFMLAA